MRLTTLWSHRSSPPMPNCGRYALSVTASNYDSCALSVSMLNYIRFDLPQKHLLLLPFVNFLSAPTICYPLFGIRNSANSQHMFFFSCGVNRLSVCLHRINNQLKKGSLLESKNKLSWGNTTMLDNGQISWSKPPRLK